ncbi:TnsA-like heteromeric transposase endonuclease subunit [Actinospica sp. MGRD01-02]|uniref:TnsA-like heteromeric transposase endonuclease subunit n=1 Tax=Actinospica acidithermotolerans TaxID=2828514 RepID=A0A941EDT6_9ACTN|nr:TnsA-like heteromeric transposase endonuclease subunit [Actinospica acidithermotolerans]MBR7829666.1 TnsA-like heteromeric transposase endonuclease subunit [Actinospica acidithermotolerans]
MPGRIAISSARIRAKDLLGAETIACEFTAAPLTGLLAAGPWRTFRWYFGQRHYSGSYWAATEKDLVIFESRLELASLLAADFDPGVSRIVAQPFLMTAQVDGIERRHVPDFLLLTGSGPLVVDVKPAAMLSKDEVAFALGWARAVVEDRGWRYEIWSEPSAARLENLRFLAGYRRSWLFDPVLLTRVQAGFEDGMTLGEAFGAGHQADARLVRPAVLHLLWSGSIVTDIDRPLSPTSIVRRAL